MAIKSKGSSGGGRDGRIRRSEQAAESAADDERGFDRRRGDAAVVDRDEDRNTSSSGNGGGCAAVVSMRDADADTTCEADRAAVLESAAPSTPSSSLPPPIVDASPPHPPSECHTSEGGATAAAATSVSPHASVLDRGDDRDFHRSASPRGGGNVRLGGSSSVGNEGNIGREHQDGGRGGGVGEKVSGGGWLSLGGWLSRDAAGKDHGSDAGSVGGRGPPASAFAALAESALATRQSGDDAPSSPGPSGSSSPQKRRGKQQIKNGEAAEEVDRYLSLREDGASLPPPPPIISRKGKSKNKTGMQRLFGRGPNAAQKKSSKESRLLDHADSAAASASSHGYSLHEVRGGGRTRDGEKMTAAERVEDRVRDECSFFYTGFDDNVDVEAARNRRRRGRSALDRQHTANDNAGQDGGAYGLDGGYDRYGGAKGEGATGKGSSLGGGALYLPDKRSRDTFLAHHERLNAWTALPHDDLELREEDGDGDRDRDDDDRSCYSAMGDGDTNRRRRHLPLPPESGSPPRIGGNGSSDGPHRPDLAARSSLYYLTTGDTGVQIRVPRDSVRLVMDPNLEPGILSVEYGAPQDEEDDDDDDKAGNDDEETSPGGGGGHRPKSAASETLDYVLTVDDELYRRLVNEISDSARIPCGLYHCCGESETSRVHIGVAMCLLSVMFVFLLVNTIIWPYG